MSRSQRWALAIVLVVTALRCYLAARFPLTEDEAYYWVWSRHLDFGYLDHPPAVAWLIATTAWLGNSPLAVRLPFILCEALAAICAGLATRTLGGSSRAAATATIMLVLIPQLRWTIGEALPDGPYVLCWAAAIWLAARAAKSGRASDMALLGAALGGALLSRFFAWALVAGVTVFSFTPEIRPIWRRYAWVAIAVTAILYAPFLVWNAKHHWATVSFTLLLRHPMEAFSFKHLWVDSTVRYLFFAAAFCATGYWVSVYSRSTPLVAWTALPLPLALVVLSFFQPVDSYWLLGPFVSLCAGIALVFDRLNVKVRVFGALAWTAGFGAALFVAIAGMWTPSQSFGGESVVYAPLAHDVLAVTQGSHTLVIANSYQVASELLYHGVPVRLGGSSLQAREWSLWDRRPFPQRALIVTDGRAADEVRDDLGTLRAVYRVRAGPRLDYRFPGAEKDYLTFWVWERAAH